MARGHKSYLLQKDAAAEKKKLEKDIGRKDLWTSLGGSLGGLLALVPGIGWAAAAALGGAGTLVGRELGDKLSGNVAGGKFYKTAREDAKAKYEAFSDEALAAAGTAALTAGTTAYAKEYAAASEAAKTAQMTTEGSSYVPPTGKEITAGMTKPWAGIGYGEGEWAPGKLVKDWVEDDVAPFFSPKQK